MREGGCACKAVRYRLTEEPLIVHARGDSAHFTTDLLTQLLRIALCTTCLVGGRCRNCCRRRLTQQGGRSVTFTLVSSRKLTC